MEALPSSAETKTSFQREVVRHMKPKAKTVTLRDVAARAGVSMATASRALSGGSASQKTRDQVRSVASEMGFVPSAAARHLSTGRTNTIAIVMAEQPDFIFRDQFLSMLVSRLAVSLSSLGLLGVLVLVDPTDSSFFRGFLQRTGVDGIIMASCHPSEELSTSIRAVNAPIVFIGRPPEDLSHYPYVDVDNFRGGYDAAMYLISSGRKRVAQIKGPAEMAPSIDRSAGFFAACQENGMDPLSIGTKAFSVEQGKKAMARLAAEHPDVDAVFAHSDQIAAGAMQTLAEQGKKIPDDVAVVGFDDFEAATALNPALTTMSQPIDKVASAAAEMMSGFLKTGDCELSKQLFRVPLVVRKSA